MSQTSFERYQLFSALLPIGMLLMIINGYVSFSFFGFEWAIWVIPSCTTIGLFAQILWYYQAYKRMYEKALNPLFYPSIATVLAHMPVVNFICMPITYKEIWFYLNHNTLDFTHRLFMGWLYAQALVIIFITSRTPEFTFHLWTLSTLMTFWGLFFINRRLMKTGIDDA